MKAGIALEGRAALKGMEPLKHPIKIELVPPQPSEEPGPKGKLWTVHAAFIDDGPWSAGMDQGVIVCGATIGVNMRHGLPWLGLSPSRQVGAHAYVHGFASVIEPTYSLARVVLGAVEVIATRDLHGQSRPDRREDLARLWASLLDRTSKAIYP